MKKKSLQVCLLQQLIKHNHLQLVMSILLYFKSILIQIDYSFINNKKNLCIDLSFKTFIVEKTYVIDILKFENKTLHCH